jgi:ribosome-binding protein aMBF1 (putative translation factor)
VASEPTNPLESIAQLSDAELVALHDEIRQRLDLAARDEPDQRKIDRQATTLAALRRVSEHLGLEDEQLFGLSVTSYDEAASELGLAVSSAQIVRAWGSWRDARLVLAGQRIPFRRQRSNAPEAELGRIAEMTQAIRAWLDSEPANHSTRAYDEWVREANATAQRANSPWPGRTTIVKQLRMGWDDCVDFVTKEAATNAPRVASKIARSGVNAAAREARRSFELDAVRVGLRVRALREVAGWSQLDLSYLSGLPQSSISKMERGLTTPSLKTLALLGRCLDISSDRLLNASREEFKAELDKREHYRAILTLTQG